MNKESKRRFIKIGFVIVLATMLLLGGTALAQLVIPATEPGGAFVDLVPSYISGDPIYQNITPPDENPTMGVNNPGAVFSYYQVAGATLRSRSSTTGFAYDGVGCTHTTSNSTDGNILNTELIVPDNAVIKYLRVYYSDTNPSSGVEGFITKYQPGVSTIDLVHTGSTDPFQTGYGFTVSQEITETVNNTVYAYTLIGWPDVNNTANKICGLRVAYYAPFHGNLFMPVVNR